MYFRHSAVHHVFTQPRRPCPKYKITGCFQAKGWSSEVQMHLEHNKRPREMLAAAVRPWEVDGTPFPPLPIQRRSLLPTVPAVWPHHGQNDAAFLHVPGRRGMGPVVVPGSHPHPCPTPHPLTGQGVGRTQRCQALALVLAIAKHQRSHLLFPGGHCQQWE